MDKIKVTYRKEEFYPVFIPTPPNYEFKYIYTYELPTELVEKYNKALNEFTLVWDELRELVYDRY